VPPKISAVLSSAKPATLAIPAPIRLLLLFTLVAQLGDAITFALGSQMIGIGYESNGVNRSVYHHAGLSGVLLLKGGAILLTLGVLTLLAQRLPRAFFIGAVVAVALGFLGLLSNTTTVASLIG
jgi:hypothetical protein